MIEKLLPSWATEAMIGGLALACAGAVWLLLDAHVQLGAARLQAAVNGASLSVIQQQEDRNVAIDQKLAALTQARDQVIKETVHEIYVAPDGTACRESAPMRALDGRLRYSAGGSDGRSPGTAAPAGGVPPAGR